MNKYFVIVLGKSDRVKKGSKCEVLGQNRHGFAVVGRAEGRKSKAGANTHLRLYLNILTPERDKIIRKKLFQTDDFLTLLLEQCRAGLLLHKVKC